MRTEPVILAQGVVLIEIALLIFMVVFLAIVAWVVLARPGRFRKAANIPLEDDVVTPRVGGDGHGNDDSGRAERRSAAEHAKDGAT